MAGVPYLIGYWKPNWSIKWFRSKCPLFLADSVILEEIATEEQKVAKVIGPFLSEGTDVFVMSPKRRTFYFPELENLNCGDFQDCSSQPNVAFLPLQSL